MGYSFFERVALAPADAIFQLTIAFMEDPRPHKVNLSVGLYRDEKLETPVLKTVKAAEKYLLSHEMTKEYLPISGDAVYIEESGRLIFGDALWKERHGKICGMQTPGGTGALRVGGDFIRKEAADTIAIPEPTWPNHPGVFKQCGFKIHPYSYYDLKKEHLDSAAIFEMLKKIPEKSAVLFHACCHNPTGADLSKEEWEKAAEIIKERELLPFFDFAYQGFGKGIDEDAYSKNFGLYSERVGSVFVVTHSEDAAKNALSKIKIFARTSYSNPPKHGAAVVAHILSNAELRQEWIKEVDAMRHRLEALRKEFVAALQAGQKKRDFSYLLKRVGMFCYLGLDKEKVSQLRDEYGIYMAEGGRMNLAGLSRGNFNCVIESMIKKL
jgi:aspartate/tyrosine/aromatic aminotransferase